MLMKLKWKGLRTIGKALMIMSALGVGAALAQAEVKTIEAGKLTVGFNGDMPMTSYKDGKLVGTDGELLAVLAEKLGLTVKPAQMEWSAIIQATKQGQVDIMLGSMGWTEERSKVMLLTDPIYYFSTTLLQKKENNYTTFADMKGKAVGTVTGFTPIPEMKTVEGIGAVKLYDTSDAVIRDLAAGRIDMAVLDPTLVEYALLQHPEWGLHQLPLTPEPEKFPIMSTKYYSIMAVYPENKDLYEKINAEIKNAWDTCLNVKVMAKYGLGAPMWFDPPLKSYRSGVDRSADWQQPKADPKCFTK